MVTHNTNLFREAAQGSIPRRWAALDGRQCHLRVDGGDPAQPSGDTSRRVQLPRWATGLSLRLSAHRGRLPILFNPSHEARSAHFARDAEGGDDGSSAKTIALSTNGVLRLRTDLKSTAHEYLSILSIVCRECLRLLRNRHQTLHYSWAAELNSSSEV